MSAIDGLPHTWGQTFVSGGDVLVRVYGGALNVNRHLGGGEKGISQILMVMVQMTPISWEHYQGIGMTFV